MVWYQLLYRGDFACQSFSIVGFPVSRVAVYYLAVIGMVVFIGAIYEGFSDKRLARLTVGSVLTLQAAALVHNLLIWRNTADVAGHVCQSFPGSDGTSALVLDLPVARFGVYFLANGFSNCIYVNSGKRIRIKSPQAGNSKPDQTKVDEVWRWDERSELLTPLK